MLQVRALPGSPSPCNDSVIAICDGCPFPGIATRRIFLVELRSVQDMSVTDPSPTGSVGAMGRRAFDRFNGLARAAASAPLLNSPYLRLWAVWGKELRRSALVHPDRTFF